MYTLSNKVKWSFSTLSTLTFVPAKSRRIMKLFLSMFLALPFLIGAQTEATAQGFSALLEKLEISVKDSEPNWKLERKEPQANSTTYCWKSAAKEVTVEITSTASAQEALNMLKSTAMRVPVAPKPVTQSIGDKAVLYKMDRADSSMLLYTKSNIFVKVSASDFNDTDRFARLIADQIPSKSNK